MQQILRRRTRSVVLWTASIMLLTSPLWQSSSWASEAASGAGSTLAGTRSLSAASTPEPFDFVFDLRTLTGWQRSVTKETLRSFDFDWRLLIPHLVAGAPSSRIEIRTGDLAAWKAVGLAWPPPVNRIVVEASITDRSWFRAILMHELGHVVDHHLVAAEGLTDELEAIFDRTWDELSHPFVNIFSQAFSSFEVVDTVVGVTDEQVLEVRALLGGSGPSPAKSQDVILGSPSEGELT